MKYILMMNCPKTGYDTFGAWPKKDIQANIAFMHGLNKALRESGELVSAEGLADPKQAKVVRAGKDGEPITDGVFPQANAIQVASGRVPARVRSEMSRRRRETAAAMEIDAIAPGIQAEEDDTLILLFMCCHPALTPASAIALTLRAVGGLTTAEIANAFLVPEATMAQRISRAKQRIKASGVPFQLPGSDERAERLRSVLHVLYLIFNEGYVSSIGRDLHRAELSGEAIRLTRAGHRLLPDNGEVSGLLAP